MVAITFPKEDPTLEAMKKAVEESYNGERKRRSYIGASAIGHECSRKIWFSINHDWLEQHYKIIYKPISFKNMAAIEDGHRTEDIVAGWLRKVPQVTLYTHKDDGSQFGFDWGFMRGHYDGVITGLLQAPQTPHIWENKCVNDKKFNDLKKLISQYGEKNALKEWDYQYYAQAVVYMYAEDLPRHYMTVASSGGRDIVSVRTNEDKKTAEALIEKAKRIKKATQPPEKIGGKDYFVCKWCEFYDVCYGENAK